MVWAKDFLGVTPLHIAACHNHRHVVRVLVKFGANISSKTLNGSTPLHSAAACGALEVTDQLVYHGAILDAADDVHSNHFSGHPRLAKFYDDEELRKEHKLFPVAGCIYQFGDTRFQCKCSRFAWSVGAAFGC